MNTRRGKGYFYWLGALDAHKYGAWSHMKRSYPKWAMDAYIDGFYSNIE